MSPICVPDICCAMEVVYHYNCLKLELKDEIQYYTLQKSLTTCNTADNIFMLPDALHNSSITKRNDLETVLPITT